MIKYSTRSILAVRKQTLKNGTYARRFKNLSKTMFGSKACASSPGQFFYFLRSLWLRKFVNTFIISGGKKKSAKVVLKTLFFLKFDEFLNSKRISKRFFKVSKNLLKIHALRVRAKKRINILMKEKVPNSVLDEASYFFDFGWRPYSWYLENSMIFHKKFDKSRRKMPAMPRVKKLSKFGMSGWFWIVSVLDLLRIPIFTKMTYIGYTPKMVSKVLSWAQQFSLVLVWFRKALVYRKATDKPSAEKLFSELDYSLDASLSIVRSRRDVMLEAVESARKYNHFRWNPRIGKVWRTKLRRQILVWYSTGIGKLNPHKINSYRPAIFSRFRDALYKPLIEKEDDLAFRIRQDTLFSSDYTLLPFFLDSFNYFFFEKDGMFYEQLRNRVYLDSVLNKRSFRRVGFFYNKADKPGVLENLENRYKLVP